MTILTKVDIVCDSVIIPKGTKGTVVAFEWGDKKQGFVVDFPQLSKVFVSKEQTVKSDEKVIVEKNV